jgi:hypothetical protein
MRAFGRYLLDAGVQYYGRHDEADRRPVRYKSGAVLDITTTLDPDMVEAYRAGSTFLAERIRSVSQPKLSDCWTKDRAPRNSGAA